MALSLWGLPAPSLGLLKWWDIFVQISLMLVEDTLIRSFHQLVTHISLFLLVLFLWNRSYLLGFCLVLCLVCFYPLLSESSRAGSVGKGMGCTRSSLEPTLCQRDEAEFLTRWRRASVDNSVGSSQSSSDISLVKIEEKEAMNVGAGGTCHPYWTSELPEILGVIIIAVLAFTWFRRWNRKQYNKQMRRAIGQSLALQTVSASVPIQGPIGPDSAYEGWGARSLD